MRPRLDNKWQLNGVFPILFAFLILFSIPIQLAAVDSDSCLRSLGQIALSDIPAERKDLAAYNFRWFATTASAFLIGYGVGGMLREPGTANFITNHFSNFMGSAAFAAMQLSLARESSTKSKWLRPTIFCIGICLNFIGEFVPPTSGFDYIDVLAGTSGTGLMIYLDKSREKRFRYQTESSQTSTAHEK